MSTPHDPRTGELRDDATPSTATPPRRASRGAPPRPGAFRPRPKVERSPEELAEAERVRAADAARRQRELDAMVALVPELRPPGSPPSKAERLRPGELTTEAATEVHRWTRETATGRTTSLVLSRSLDPGRAAYGLHTEYVDGGGLKWRTRGALIPADVAGELAAALATEVR